MRADKNLICFLMNPDWYTFVVGKGYVPTTKAPIEAVEAMEAYNSYTYNTSKKQYQSGNVKAENRTDSEESY